MNLTCTNMGFTYEKSFDISLKVIAGLMVVAIFPTLLLNLSLLATIFKRRSFHGPAFVIMANLAVSDTLTSCIGYAAFATTCYMLLNNKDPCTAALVLAPVTYILGFTSFYTIILQACERYFSVLHPFWYHERFTVKFTIIACHFTWALAFLNVMLWKFITAPLALGIYYGAVNVFGIIAIIYFHVKVFRETKKIQRRIADQIPNAEERSRIFSESKITRVTILVLSAFFFCFLPDLILVFLISISGGKREDFGEFQYWAWTSAALNSLLNPLITLHQLTTLRKSVIDLWKKVLPCC